MMIQSVIKYFGTYCFYWLYLYLNLLWLDYFDIANMGTPDEFLESGLGRYLGMVGTNIIYLWLIGLMHRIINKKNSWTADKNIGYWIIVIPIISIFLLQTMLDGFVGSNTYSYVSLGVSLAGIIFINLAMFKFLWKFWR